MNAEKKAKLRQIVGLFDQAENLLKEVEKVCGDLTVPSINQLRYVGYHIARAIVAQHDDSFFDELKKAENHCKRAIYDAYEVGILYFLDGIKIQIVGRGMKPRPRPKGRELRLSPFGIPHRLVPAASCGVFSE